MNIEKKVLKIETDIPLEVPISTNPSTNSNSSKNTFNSKYKPDLITNSKLLDIHSLSFKLNCTLYINDKGKSENNVISKKLASSCNSNIMLFNKNFGYQDDIITFNSVGHRTFDYVIESRGTKIKVTGESNIVDYLDESYNLHKDKKLIDIILDNSSLVITDKTPKYIIEYVELCKKHTELNSKKKKKFLKEIEKFYEKYNFIPNLNSENKKSFKSTFMSKHVSMEACEQFLVSEIGYSIFSGNVI